MLKKVLLQTQFGSPHPWTEQYINAFQRLAPTGWHLKIFTPNALKPFGNVEVIPMTIEQFDDLMLEECGVRVGNRLTPQGVPSKLVSDFYPAYGAIFRDYIKDADYWWNSNWDCTYGRLSKFVPDSELEKFEVWSDDSSPAINGIFCLWKNNEFVNNLYRRVPNWEASFTLHEPTAFDEVQMTKTMRELEASGEVNFGYPELFPFHSYDRLPQHLPAPNVYFEGDALIEKFEDPWMPKGYICAPKDHHGREIMMLHWSKSKRWPIAA